MAEYLPQGLVMYIWSVFGAMLLWTKITAQKKKLNIFGDILEHLISSPGARTVVQFLIFVFFGALIAVEVVAPITQSQALAAGMAWSRLTARD